MDGRRQHLLSRLAEHSRERAVGQLLARGARPTSLSCDPQLDVDDTDHPDTVHALAAAATTETDRLVQYCRSGGAPARAAGANPACPNDARLDVLAAALADESFQYGHSRDLGLDTDRWQIVATLAEDGYPGTYGELLNTALKLLEPHQRRDA